MFRRLLTCLALITGLAAAGAPANAAMIEVLSEQVGASSVSSQSGNSELVECAAQPLSSPRKTDRWAVCTSCQHAAIVIPTTYIGIDRAYE